MDNSLWITDTSIHVDIYNWQVGNNRTKERKRTQDVAGGGGKSEGRRKEVLRDGRWGIVVSSRRRREEDGRDREREREREGEQVDGTHLPASCCNTRARCQHRCIETEAEELPSGTSRTRVLQDLPNRKLFDFPPWEEWQPGNVARVWTGRRRKGGEGRGWMVKGRGEIANKMRENEPVIFILGIPGRHCFSQSGHSCPDRRGKANAYTPGLRIVATARCNTYTRFTNWYCPKDNWRSHYSPPVTSIYDRPIMRYRVLVLPLSPRRTPTVPRDPSRTLPAPRPSYRQNSNRECRDVLDPCYALIKRTYLFPFLFPFFHFYPQRLFPLSLSLSPSCTARRWSCYRFSARESSRRDLAFVTFDDFIRKTQGERNTRGYENGEDGRWKSPCIPLLFFPVIFFYGSFEMIYDDRRSE